MKHVLFCALVALSFVACSPAKMTQSLYGNSYQYTYTLDNADSSLVFEDSTIKVNFIFARKEIDFVLTNKTSSPLKIHWDDASLVIMGDAKKVMHKGIKYIDRNSAQPATTIPPKASWDDLVLPTDNVYYREGTYGKYYSSAGGWETKELFPTLDGHKETTRQLIESLAGQQLSLYLPIKSIDGKDLGYNFVFTISQVRCVNCKTTTNG